MSNTTTGNSSSSSSSSSDNVIIITITIVDVSNASSESLSLSNRATISDLVEFMLALLPSLGRNTTNSTGSIDSSEDEPLQLLKDGKILYTTGTSSSTTTSSAERTTMTLRELGITDNDIIACRRGVVSGNTVTNNTTSSTGTDADRARTGTNTAVLPTQPQSSASASVGLDFTSLLQDFNHPSSLPSTANTAVTTHSQHTPPPVDYVYHGATMNLQEAQYYNPHPTNMVTLLFDKPHLLKELNYYAPTLAQQLISLQQQSSDTKNSNEMMKNASEIYRNHMIQQSITSAFNKTSKFHLENQMKLRHAQNPNDVEASEYMQKQERQKLIQEQYEYVMNEYPESVVGRVLMLYIPMKINGFPVSAFIDSGAQQTIMSLSLAKQCQIDQYIDTRMAGIAVGVGTGVILGRIHMVQIEITSTITNQIYYFPCSLTIMDDPPKSKRTTANGLTSGSSTDHAMDGDDGDDETVGGKEMPFLFGLDMLRRHLCCLDMSQGCLRFTQIRIDNAQSITTPSMDTTGSANDDVNHTASSIPQYLEVPFLHEKDLLPSQGGTMKPKPNAD